MPRLQHANSAVVLSAIKVILQYMHEALDPESELCVGYRKKLSPPLVTMVGCGVPCLRVTRRWRKFNWISYKSGEQGGEASDDGRAGLRRDGGVAVRQC